MIKMRRKREVKTEIDLEGSSSREMINHEIGFISGIRLQAIRDGSINPTTKDQYLDSISRISKSLEGIIRSNTAEAINSIIIMTRDEPALLEYDVNQSEYWAKKIPEFEENLDYITITALGENLASMESKHHIYQAIKHLGVREAPFSEKEKIYNTINPFQANSLRAKKKGLFSSTISRIAGYSFDVLSDDGKTIRVRGDPSYLDSLIEQATRQGYSTLQIDLDIKSAKKIKESIPEATISEQVQERSTPKRELTKWLYPFVGSLPRSIQSKIADSYEFSPTDASFKSALGEIAMGAGMAALTLTPIGSIGLLLPASYLALEGIIRAKNVNQNDVSIGVLPLKLACLPYEIAEGVNNASGSSKEYTLSIPLKKTESIQAENIEASKFTELAQVNISLEGEQNLVWSTANHNNYGKIFSQEIEQKVQNMTDVEKIIDRENQTYTITSRTNLGKYTKIIAVSFKSNERYVTTIITNDGTKQDTPAIINRILNQNVPAFQKSEQIALQFNADYTHLTRIEAGKIVENYTTN